MEHGIDLIYRLLARIGFTDPIHPPFTHVPIGLIVGAFLLGLVSFWFHRPVAGRAARYCTSMAIIFLFAAAAFGYWDWQYFFAGGWLQPIRFKLILAGVLLILLLWALTEGRRNEQTSGRVASIYTACFLVALGLGYFGGKLVYAGRIPAGTPVLRAGETLFRGNCSGCHPYGGNIAEPASPLRGSDELGDAAVFLHRIRDPRMDNGKRGAMPPFPPSRITDAQVLELRQYLTSVMGDVPAQSSDQTTIPRISVRTDAASIERGRSIFAASCVFCHTVESRETEVGPGLQGILKRERLPASGRPATPENLYRQLRQPYRSMPSFAKSLSDDDVANLMAYLNTR
jgi:mono/diheme cytochrome c family protein